MRPVPPRAAVSGKSGPANVDLRQINIVQLDLPTLVTMGSFVSACAGIVLLVAWWQHRDVPALALWGLGNFVDTSGIFCLMVGPVLQRPALIMLADGLLDFRAVYEEQMKDHRAGDLVSCAISRSRR